MTARFARLLLLLFALGPVPAIAHEVRPAYLEMHETAPGTVDVLWKTPMVGEMRLALAPVLSGEQEVASPLATRRTGTAAVQTWRWKLAEPLRGRTLAIDNLDSTMTDVLVRVQFADGTEWTERLTPNRHELEIPMKSGPGAIAWTYFTLGIEHILLGIDHLLFVLALLLVTEGWRRLIWTITAFTVAHSITLALATMGFVSMPSAPVEAVIALSIVFVAAEIIRTRRGMPGLTARAPWIVAFTFGLLHGFGFAGALAEIGLPQGQIPLALFLFNVGVEAGQLMFVAAVLAVIALASRLRFQPPRWAWLVPPYAIGTMATFWVFQRLAVF